MRFCSLILVPFWILVLCLLMVTHCCCHSRSLWYLLLHRETTGQISIALELMVFLIASKMKKIHQSRSWTVHQLLDFSHMITKEHHQSRIQLALTVVRLQRLKMLNQVFLLIYVKKFKLLFATYWVFCTGINICSSKYDG